MHADSEPLEFVAARPDRILMKVRRDHQVRCAKCSRFLRSDNGLPEEFDSLTRRIVVHKGADLACILAENMRELEAVPPGSVHRDAPPPQ